MSNIDSLLDLGLGVEAMSPSDESPPSSDAPSPNAFDPFAMPISPQSPLKAQEQDFNVFDPFATIDQGITPTDDVEGDFFGCSAELTRSHESDDLKRIASTDQDADLLGDFTADSEEQRLDEQDLDLLVSHRMDATESEKREYEAQFNDLLGDLDPKSDGHVNGVMSNGDLMETHTTTTTEMHNGEGTVTTVTETKSYTGYTEDNEMGGNAADDSYDDQQSEGMVSSDISDRASEGDSIQEGQGYPPASPSRIEDQLPEFQPPKRYVKPEEKQSKAPGVFITSSRGEVDQAQKPSKYGGASGDSMCKLCGKRVYEMEKMIAEKAIYHKMCFKCTHCKRILSLTNFASLDGNMYCKPHFIEIFKTKGNYEEGFGIERSTRQWQKDSSPDLIRDTSVRSEDEEEREITRAEDKADDGIESVPSIRNIKSRFEDSADRGSTSPELRSPTSPTGRYENGDGRKAVRRMTPPRDEMSLHAAHLAHVDVERDPAVVRSGEPNPEEELPPAQYTKSMLAKFKSLEDTEQPSPKRSPGPAGPRKSQSFREVRTKSSPDSGISDSETHQPTINGKYSRSEDDLLGERDVVRETDKHEEEELPEKGFTKSLLAQWRSKKKKVPTATLR